MTDNPLRLLLVYIACERRQALASYRAWRRVRYYRHLYPEREAARGYRLSYETSMRRARKMLDRYRTQKTS